MHHHLFFLFFFVTAIDLSHEALLCGVPAYCYYSTSGSVVGFEPLMTDEFICSQACEANGNCAAFYVQKIVGYDGEDDSSGCYLLENSCTTSRLMPYATKIDIAPGGGSIVTSYKYWEQGCF